MAAYSSTEWFRDLGDWQPAGKHNCNPAATHQHRSRRGVTAGVADSPEATVAISGSRISASPRHAGAAGAAGGSVAVGAAAVAGTGAAGATTSTGRSDAFSLLPAAFDQRGSNSNNAPGSLPFWTPSAAATEEEMERQRRQRLARSAQRGGDLSEKASTIQAPFQVNALLQNADQQVMAERQQQQQQQQQPFSTASSDSYALSSSNNTSWVAFAPLAPEEIAPAVAAIVVAAGRRCVSRYLAEPIVASRLLSGTGGAAASLSGSSVVYTLYFFCTTREDAAGLIHAHSRKPIFRSNKLGRELTCAFTDPPASSATTAPLWCGRLELMSGNQDVDEGNHMHAAESAAARELASRARPGNVSVCQKLQVLQDVSLMFQFACLLKAYGRKAVTGFTVILALWYWFFY